MDKIYFAKLKPNAKIPTKRKEDGWYDLYACIDEDIIIPPHENRLIPTGICSAFDKKYRIGLYERGSNTKFNGIVMAGRIDSGFRGEWFVSIYNGNKYSIIVTNKYLRTSPLPDVGCLYISTEKAICQFAVEEVPQVEICETEIDTINSFTSERGIGILGSSGK